MFHINYVLSLFDYNLKVVGKQFKNRIKVLRNR